MCWQIKSVKGVVGKLYKNMGE